MNMYRVKVRVKELCQQRNWSLNELAMRSGATYTTVRRYAMQTMTKIDIDSVSRIKETFGCSWEELLELLGDGSFEE